MRAAEAITVLNFVFSVLSPCALEGSASHGVVPPNSIRNGEATALVSFRHERFRVTACVPAKESREACSAALVGISSDTVVLLVPIPDGRAIQHKDPRTRERLDLGGRNPNQASVRLGVGVWEIQWQGAASARLRVRKGEDLGVTLTAIIGQCIKAGGECRLIPDRTTRTIRIPVEHEIP
jgi:hypothetical protein